MKKKTVIYLLTVLGFVPLAIWCYHFIDYDLWYDEVYSLEEFALKDFSTTFFYYPAPNNHIFYNFTTQLISRVFGYREIFAVETHTYIFRGFQLVISLFTVFFSVRILKHFFGYKSSFLLYAILFTTIPYMNFSLQLRGYNMSALFIIMLVYYSWSYMAAKRNFSLLVVLISSLLLLYTIPSNLYALLAFGLLLFFSWLHYYRKKDVVSKLYFNAMVAVFIGAVVAFLLYLPVLQDVIFNKYSNRGPFGLLYSFHVLRIAVFDFFSSRFLLLLLLLPGLFIFYKKSSTKERYYFLFLAALFFVPFVLSFFHQKAPFPRVFIPLAPIFCMLLTVPIIKFIDNNLPLYQTRILQALVSVYCVFVFLNEIDKNDAVISKSMVDNNIESQDLYRNYYLGSFFKQDSTLNYLDKIYNDFPVVKYDQRDQPSTDLYLRKYEIPFREIDTITDISEELKERGKVYILTSFKNRTLETLKRMDSIESTVLTPEYAFTNIICVERQN
ncbi:hypothetical protein [Aequorivita lipolytica]|uniref:Glycosyltransferase RgtA/B/C/D-like domain-containing protein n=1 Tax=Aequorivita lipolytica TaxID=153267 RepID=A0A5C6YNX1_9FLAO|nr:hypothetical protein [Aequorivita lipolytica]TXD68999.1 hypothetical protein ESV24_09620 [Aequorivita lipolytica]SRX52974.1 hypothetical protein AEQU2_02248 [Aequorivita lipolytica]